MERIKAERIAGSARKTLGTLVGELLGSYIVANQIDSPLEAEVDSQEAANSISLRFRTSLSEEDFVRTENGLKELVLLRNDLVHHFIERYDIGSLDGCRQGREALVDAFSKINHHFDELRTWAEDMLKLRGQAAQLVQSDEFLNLLLNGINPDGTVFWPNAGIVRVLQEAADELAVDGWATVPEAVTWIAERYPEQRPEKYGCTSWQQVVNEARIFELQYFEKGGRRTACYRKRE